MEQVVPQLEDKVVAVEADVTNLQTGMEAVTKQLGEHDTQLNTLSGQVTQYATEAGELRSKVDALSGSVGQYDTRITDNENMVQVLEGDITNLQTSIVTITDQVNTLNSLVSGMESSLTTVQTELATIKLITDRMANGTAGQVWTATSENPSGEWQDAPGGLPSKEGLVTYESYVVATDRATLNPIWERPPMDFNYRVALCAGLGGTNLLDAGLPENGLHTLKLNLAFRGFSVYFTDNTSAYFGPGSMDISIPVYFSGNADDRAYVPISVHRFCDADEMTRVFCQATAMLTFEEITGQTPVIVKLTNFGTQIPSSDNVTFLTIATTIGSKRIKSVDSMTIDIKISGIE